VKKWKEVPLMESRLSDRCKMPKEFVISAVLIQFDSCQSVKMIICDTTSVSQGQKKLLGSYRIIF
jgi:hypothetical protein